MTRLICGQQISGTLYGQGQLGRGVDFADHVLSAVRLGPTGKCPKDPDKPVLAIFDPDHSGSVVSGGGADPVGNRFREMRMAIETVAKRCKCGRELVAMLNFDSPNSGDVPPTPLRGAMGSIERGLTIPRDAGGCSLLGPSLLQARRIADQHPDHHVVLVVLSDFLLFDSDVPRVLNDFANFPGQPHAVVLRATPPQALVADPRVIVTAINPTDPPGALTKAIFGTLTATRRMPSRRTS
jgi:hypothetical protein